MMEPFVLPCGPRAFLLEFGSIDEVMAADRALGLTALGSSGRLTEIVPAALTILVAHDGSVDGPEVVEALRSASPTASHSVAAPIVEISVRYDGDDLGVVADVCGMSTEEVVRRHSGALYECAFCGFMPGFSYLTGLDPALWLPRRATPRTRVPSGSVAIAAEFSAVYPGESPGGWHLLGTTTALMWDESAQSPALVPPGTRVRFVVA